MSLCVLEGRWEEGDKCPIALAELERLRGETCKGDVGVGIAAPPAHELQPWNRVHVCYDTAFAIVVCWVTESVDVVFA